EDGIRDLIVTGVQTCALPIYLSVLHQSLTRGSKRRCLELRRQRARVPELQVDSVGTGSRRVLTPVDGGQRARRLSVARAARAEEIGRASCRERGWSRVGARGV